MSLKLLSHLDRIQSLLRGHPTGPVKVVFMPNQSCNFRCSFCAYYQQIPLGERYSQRFNPSDFMSLEMIQEFLADCRTLEVKALEISGGGEPMLYPYFPELLAQSEGLDVGIITNGTKLWKFRDLLKQAVWIRVSLDAGTPATYRQIHRAGPDDWALVGKGLQELSTAGPYLGTSFVVTKENFPEIVAAAQWSKGQGARSIRFTAVLTEERSRYYGRCRVPIREQLSSASELADPNFAVIDQWEQRSQEFDQTPDYPFCGMRHLAPVVTGDGSVYACCMWAFHKEGYLGSLRAQRFEDLWYSRWLFESHDPRRDCPIPCLYQGQNRFIMALKKSPEHANFI